MRIAMIAPPWVPVPPPAYGGTEFVVDLLSRGFKAQGHEVLLFATADSTCPVDRSWVVQSAADVPMGALFVELEHVINAYQKASEWNADIVYDHTTSGLLYSENFPHLRVVTMSHNDFTPQMLDIYRQVVDRIPIIAISEAQSKITHDVPVTRIIHHGIDTDVVKAGPGDGDYFLYLGRMAPWKGAAIAASVARKAGAKLKIAAKLREVFEKEYFHAEVEPLLGDGIEFLGEVDYDEKFELLQHAKGLINPIRWNEPFGLAMIESLASGTPVLTYPEGAAPEIVEDGVTGRLCNDEAELEQAIRTVDQLDRAACRHAAETKFSARNTVLRHLEFFEELLQQPAGVQAH